MKRKTYLAGALFAALATTLAGAIHGSLAQQEGPQADPYWQQFAPTAQPAAVITWVSDNVEAGGPQADPYWRQFAPRQETLAVANGPGEVALTQGGPEADPYWRQFVPRDQMAMAAVDLPDALAASTWRLVDYQLIGPDNTIHFPLGEDAVGYLLISPEHYAAVNIASANGSAGSGISYVGKLDYQGDKSIHPFVSVDPALLGVDQVKTWDLRGNQLVLTTPPSAADGSFGKMVWELVK
jgi:hypothetical protein